MSIEQTPHLLTPGKIASELREPLHRVNYVLSTRDHIQPAAFAGRIRLYRSEAKAMVRHELNAIDAKASSSREASR